MKKEQLDDIDKEIIRILQNNARTSYREIQNQLKISIGTIHKLTFLIRIHIDGKHTEDILSEIAEIPEVCSVFHTTGEQSAALICRFKESEDVHNFIRELNKKEYITRTNSNMILKEYKNSSFVEL